MRSKFFILYKHGLEEQIQWPEGWGNTCRGNLHRMLSEVLKTNAIACELKGFWNNQHLWSVKDEYNVTIQQLEDYVRAKTGSLHFQSKGTRDRAIKALTKMGGTGLMPVDTYREVLLHQAYYHQHQEFPEQQ